MPAPATAVPAAFRSGDTVAWALTLPDYDAADGWLLTYTFVSPAQVKTLTASGAGTTYTTTLAAADSVAWAAADFAWQATISKGGERYTVGTGRITVLPSLVGAVAGLDSRGHARKVVDAIEAVIEGRAGEAESDLQINGRAIKYIPVAELLALRDRYKLELNMGAAAGAFANTPRGMPDLRVRFTGT
jgi:hypothetical protein